MITAAVVACLASGSAASFTSTTPDIVKPHFGLWDFQLMYRQDMESLSMQWYQNLQMSWLGMPASAELISAPNCLVVLGTPLIYGPASVSAVLGISMPW